VEVGSSGDYWAVTRVLVIDDEEMMRLAMSVMLRGRGMEVETAANGAEALEKARQWVPDVVVCDLSMPVMDGFEFLAELRRAEKLRDVPVVVVTGLGVTDYRERALESGAADFVVKPFGPDQLMAAIRPLLA
jgi:CheY-like chemotaxis protein